ncbi:MAG: hypothetical protein AB1756_07625 [Acidobacteriota bacterium]
MSRGNEGNEQVESGMDREAKGREEAGMRQTFSSREDLNPSKDIRWCAFWLDDVVNSLRRGRALGHKTQMKVLDDAVHNDPIGQKGDDPHLTFTFRADEGIDLIDFFDHLPMERIREKRIRAAGM